MKIRDWEDGNGLQMAESTEARVVRYREVISRKTNKGESPAHISRVGVGIFSCWS